MQSWEAIQKSLELIENNLTEDISIEQLAKEAALSPYYYQRLFNRLVKKPVKEYIQLRRLAGASDALKKQNQRITDIAALYQFSDHANFTRAFRDTYGITPEQYRNCSLRLEHFVKPELCFAYSEAEEGVPFLADGITVEIIRKKLDTERYFQGIQTELPGAAVADGRTTGISMAGNLWDSFHEVKKKFLNLLPNGNEIGVLYQGESRDGFAAYLTGAEVSIISEDCIYPSFILPCREYVICCFEAETFEELTGAAIFKAQRFLEHWIRQHNLACGSFVAELYSCKTPDCNYMELWLPINTAPSSLLESDSGKEVWDKVNPIQKPSCDTISHYVNNPLWSELCLFLETEYQCRPELEYSKCSLQKGWNVKYKKSGRSLCTLYPMNGYFTVLIVISEKERMEAELMLPFCSEYLQQLYKDTKTGMGQKWLMIDVRDGAVLAEVKDLIAIRRGRKNKKTAI